MPNRLRFDAPLQEVINLTEPSPSSTTQPTTQTPNHGPDASTIPGATHSSHGNLPPDNDANPQKRMRRSPVEPFPAITFNAAYRLLDQHIAATLTHKGNVPPGTISSIHRLAVNNQRQLQKVIVTFESDTAAEATSNALATADLTNIIFGQISLCAAPAALPPDITAAFTNLPADMSAVQFPIMSCLISTCKCCSALNQPTFTNTFALQHHYGHFHADILSALDSAQYSQFIAFIGWARCPRCNILCFSDAYLQSHLCTRQDPSPPPVEDTTMADTAATLPAPTVDELLDPTQPLEPQYQLLLPDAFDICPPAAHRALIDSILPTDTEADVISKAQALRSTLGLHP